MNWLDDDLNIFYMPATGGFFLLNLILLENKHYAYFKNNVKKSYMEQFFKLYPDKEQYYKLTKDQYEMVKGANWPIYDDYIRRMSALPAKLQEDIVKYKWPNINLESIPGWKNFEIKNNIKRQFDISSADQWKKNEFWPDNDITAETPPLGDLKYKIFFHCNKFDSWMSSPGKKIVLYTNVEFQTRMGWHKHAGLFVDSLNNRNYKFIKNILKDSVIYDHKKIKPMYLKAFTHADKIVYLQDLINDPVKELELSGNQDQISFHKHWVDLHNNFNLLDKEMRKYNA